MDQVRIIAVAAVVTALAACALAVSAFSRDAAPRYQGVSVGNNNLQIFVVDGSTGAVRSCTIGNPAQGMPPACTPWAAQ